MGSSRFAEAEDVTTSSKEAIILKYESHSILELSVLPRSIGAKNYGETSVGPMDRAIRNLILCQVK
jgi:hypothetical protein